MPDAVVSALKEAIEGLSYMSETDAPFEPVRVDAKQGPITPERVVKLAGQSPGAKVQEVPVSDFFSALTQDQDWHGQAEKETTARYRDLHAAIQNHLSDVKVFKVGDVNLDIFIVGRTPTGDYAGVKTKAVET
jgi:hypothetical protein